jgi:predicted ATPase
LFTLNRFQVTHKDKVLYDCEFSDKSTRDRTDIFTTLIIGENGVGKSFLLKLIADFFRFIANPTKPNQIKYEQVYISYRIDSDFYTLEKNKNSVTYKKNSVRAEKSDIKLPTKILTLSFMVNDKFSFSNDKESNEKHLENDDGYKYLGIRATSNATYTSTIQKKLLNAILKILKQPQRIQSLNKINDFIGLKNSIEIEYTLKRKTLFSRGVTVDFLDKRMKSILSKKEFLNKEFVENSHVIPQDLYTFIKTLRSRFNTCRDRFSFSINTLDSSVLEFYKNHIYLRLMESLELISSPDIKFLKDDSVDFEHTSSGEKHFIFTMINLLSEIENNTLILIDEPELSLHPSWQMQYIKLLKAITVNFNTTHCLLASHSHFMVSDLTPQSSSLVTLNKGSSSDGEYRYSKLIPYDTFAWSAENILYEVFHLRTTRNMYFESDLVSLLKLVSEKSQDINEIQRLYEKLNSYVFNHNDPINHILYQTKTYLGGLVND